MFRFKSVLAACLVLALYACGDGPAAATAPSVTSNLEISANVSATPIATVVVTVTAPDIHDPPVFNFQTAGGTVSGSMEVSVGHARTFTAQAFDASGTVTHDGSATIDVVKGQNPPLALVLRPRTGQVSVTLTVASIQLTVSPTSLNLLDDSKTTGQLAATTVDPFHSAVNGLQWASTNPAVASVDANGLVTAHIIGSANIVATYGGVSATTSVSVGSGAVLFQRQGSNPGIFTIRSDGTGETQLLSGGVGVPIWSPDHGRIAFEQGGSGLVVMNADGSNPTTVVSGVVPRQMAWSPDGTKIAYISGVGSEEHVWVTDLVAHSVTQVTNTSGKTEESVTWKPDQTELLVTQVTTDPATFVTTRQLVRMGVDGTNPNLLFTGASSGSWSPGGDVVLFVSTDGILSILSPGLHTITPLGVPVVQAPTNPSWSPDGNRIVFTQFVTNALTLCVVDRDGSNFRQLTNGPRDDLASWR